MLTKKRVFHREVSQDSFIFHYLSILNGFMGLTKKQLKVLVLGIKHQDPHENLFIDKEIRYKIYSSLEISPHNLNNIIKSLKDKKILYVDGEKKYKLQSYLAFDKMNETKEIEIKFNVKVKELV